MMLGTTNIKINFNIIPILRPSFPMVLSPDLCPVRVLDPFISPFVLKMLSYSAARIVIIPSSNGNISSLCLLPEWRLTPCIINFGNKWKWVFRFTHRQLPAANLALDCRSRVSCQLFVDCLLPLSRLTVNCVSCQLFVDSLPPLTSASLNCVSCHWFVECIPLLLYFD